MTAYSPAAVAMSLLSGLAGGQTGAAPGNNTVRISGRVTDQLGAPIPRALVKFKVAALDVTPVVVHTDQGGTFAFRAEPLRKYDLVVEMPGFKTIAKTIEIQSASSTKRIIGS